jgi:predicted DNA-binding transcriptional regulator AlpA
MEPTEDRLLKASEAAEYIGRIPQVLSDWRRQGRGPRYVKHSRSVRYRRSDIEKWIDDHMVDPGDSP